MDLRLPAIANLFTAGRIKDQKFCKFGRHQERGGTLRHYRLSQHAFYVGIRNVYLSRMSVLMPFCWGCVRTVCQSWVRVYRPAHQGFTG